MERSGVGRLTEQSADPTCGPSSSDFSSALRYRHDPLAPHRGYGGAAAEPLVAHTHREVISRDHVFRCVQLNSYVPHIPTPQILPELW